MDLKPPPDIIERAKILAFLATLREQALDTLQTPDAAGVADAVLSHAIREIAVGAHSGFVVELRPDVAGALH